jgi:hypothetical protein
VNIGLCTKYTAEDEKDKYAIESVLTDRRKRRVNRERDMEKGRRQPNRQIDKKDI